MSVISRNQSIEKIEFLFSVTPAVAILGPRQCGKTTLAQILITKYAHCKVTFFDLENPRDLARLTEPLLALENIEGLIVIDEIQRRPDLFPILRVLIDQNKNKKILILGSASRELIKQSSESLAGRISYLELTPFSYPEVKNIEKLWLRGGFPHAYLAQNETISTAWRNSYITTFLEQDIPNLGITIAPNILRRFWMMLTHYHGNIFNASEIGKSLGAAHTTTRHYLDILRGTFMIRELAPWYENISKRQIKSPKIYFRDSGLLHTLLGIDNKNSLQTNPKLGASWEGFALEEIIRFHNATPEETYFWGIHAQAELDLLIIKNGKKLGFEFKYADAPQLNKSLHISQDILKLDELYIIYPGKVSYPLSKDIMVIGLESYLNAK